MKWLGPTREWIQYIQIQMNSEIRIQMPDQILALAEFALSEWLLLAIKLLAAFP